MRLVGAAATTVPSPCRTATTPITSSATSAWDRVALLIPSRTASSRSGGSRSPAIRPFSEIQAVICSATCSYSRVRTSGWGADTPRLVSLMAPLY